MIGTLNKVINKYKSLSLSVKAALWYTVCNVLNKGIALLSTPVFTRVLTEEQYGSYSIFRSWHNIIIIFTSLNVFLSGYKKGILLYKDDVKAFTSSQLGLTTTLTIIAFTVYIIFRSFWNDIFGLSTVIMIAMFIELLTMPALDLWMSKRQFDYNYRATIVTFLAMNTLCIVVAVIAVMNSNSKLEARIYSDAIVKALFAGTIFILIFIQGKRFYSKKYWLYALKYNLPLIPHYLSNYALGQSDRLMIGKMVGAKEAAYYSIAYTISTMMLLITTAINNATMPHIYKTIEKGDVRSIKTKYNPIFFFIAILSIATMAFAPEVIYIFAGKKYMDAIYVIPPIAASVFFIFIYSMYSTIEYYYQRTGKIAIATTMSAFLNLVLNYFGIQIFGYYAAGYTTLICYICLALFHYFFYRKTIRKELQNITEVYDLRVILGISVFMVAFMALMVLTYSIVYIRYGVIAILAVVVFAKKKLLISIIKGLKKE